jgi:hypothetical protein
MTVYVAVVFQRHGDSTIAGVASTEAEAAALASDEAGKPLSLSSRYCRGELEDENGDLVGCVLETVVGERFKRQN